MAQGMTYQFVLGGSLSSSFRGMAMGAQKQLTAIGKAVRHAEGSAVNSIGADIVKNRAKLVGLASSLKEAQSNLASLQARATAAGGAKGYLAVQLKRAEKEVKNLNTSLKNNKFALKESLMAAKQQSGSVKKLRDDYSALGVQIEQARKKQQRLMANQAARSANAARRSELRGGLFDAMAIGATVAVPVKMAIDFESGMADAAKTIEGMRDETGKLTPMYYAMVREAKMLGRELPLAYSAIASIMGAAGQMGLTDAKEIAEFTRDTAQMAVAFGMSNDEAAASIGGYRTALGLAQGDVRDMLDLMNYFANTSSATESGIADIVRRVGALGGVAGVSHKPLTAMAATLDSMKIAPEVASTGIQNLMLAMNAGSAATKKQKTVLEQLGFDATALAARMQTDATGAILDFLGAVKQLPKHEQAAALTRFFGRESVKSIAPLITQLDLLAENFKKTADQEKYAGSMQAEFANRSATTAGAAQKTKNRLAGLAITIGSVLLPPFNTVLTVVGAGASAMASLAEHFPVATKLITTCAAATVSLAVASKALAYGYTFIKGGVLLAQGALIRMTGVQAANTAATATGAMAQRGWRASLMASRVAALGATAATRALNFVMLKNPIALGLTIALGAAELLITKIESIGAFIQWLGKKYDEWFGATEGIDIGDSVGITPEIDWEYDDDGRVLFARPETVAAEIQGGASGQPVSVGADVQSAPVSAAATIQKTPKEAPVSQAAQVQALQAKEEQLGAGLTVSHEYAAASWQPVDYDSAPAAYEAETALMDFAYGTAPKSGALVNIDMPFTVNMESDGAAFKQKFAEYRPELEGFVRRLVRRIWDEIEHDKKRASYAG